MESEKWQPQATPLGLGCDTQLRLRVASFPVSEMTYCVEWDAKLHTIRN